MNLIVCIDDNNGLLFNKLRQSSDSEVINRIVEIIEDNKLLCNSYTAKLFDNKKCNQVINDEFLNIAEENDYCFLENSDIIPYINNVKKLIIYHWNRKYPSDKKFPTEDFLKFMKKSSTYEFKGNSHDKITEEIYIV